jgi:hypothetical protein
MKKIALAAIVVVFCASYVFAAVSSPCSGYRKPSEPRAREVVEEGYRRDPQGFRVPIQTVKEGFVHHAQATKDRENQVSGGE